MDHVTMSIGVRRELMIAQEPPTLGIGVYRVIRFLHHAYAREVIIHLRLGATRPRHHRRVDPLLAFR